MATKTSGNKIAKPALNLAQETFLPMVVNQLASSQINMGSYARQCAMSAMAIIQRIISDKGWTWNDLNKSNVVDILTTVASWELNPLAMPREVYFTIRNKKVVVRDKESGQSTDVWTKLLEVGVEGDGNDVILSKFGRNVQTVHRHWLVREQDGFTYPKHRGLEVVAPEWEPVYDSGKCVRVVYPITFTDGRTEYFIGEREEVLNNLLAHISNNMMNETFGICKDRYNANAEQKKMIDTKKREIMDKAMGMGFDLLDDPEFEPLLSPAWQSPYSREQMIIRKMRNNIVKKIPKDFSIPQGAVTFEKAEDGSGETVIEADFSEIGITQNVDEKQQLEVLNQSLGGEPDGTH